MFLIFQLPNSGRGQAYIMHIYLEKVVKTSHFIPALRKEGLQGMGNWCWRSMEKVSWMGVSASVSSSSCLPPLLPLLMFIEHLLHSVRYNKWIRKGFLLKSLQVSWWVVGGEIDYAQKWQSRKWPERTEQALYKLRRKNLRLTSGIKKLVNGGDLIWSEFWWMGTVRTQGLGRKRYSSRKEYHI